MNISGILQESFKLLIAAGATIVFHRREFSFQPSDITTLANAIASSSGTILGFLITAIALMASVMDRGLLKNLRATGGYRVLISGSFTCAALFLTLLALSLSLLLPGASQAHWLLLATIFVGVLAAINLALSGLGFYRVIMSISRS
ncbi:hypothetical protein JYG36_13565 [Pseudomonas sp. SORT22]|uniref:hypothetical protein n=1 Tax=Pseudomonas sp. SORT22 TaxID=2813842 RepID=UPI001BCD054A|nr:hypothetical protein [Pseudomonas sp. SORT22]QVM94155.1 hypothetical protein JYG36_13565 [Pseudomonas sp. SORT22]